MLTTGFELSLRLFNPLSLSFCFLHRTVLEEDEVCSVAQLLGDLVTYRASGTGHLELLAG